MREDQSTQDWVNLDKSNIFEVLFEQGHKLKEDIAAIMSLAKSNSGFDPVNFITKINTEGCKQVT